MATSSSDDPAGKEIAGPTRHDAPIHLAEYDPAWPGRFAAEASRLRAAIGASAIAIEHVGSTSVPGLAAKPIIDVILVVADSSDEASYVPALEAVGYVLRVREPEWFEHRVLKGPVIDANVHVFSAGCSEIGRMVAFRDHLRANEDDRRLYEQTKRRLAVQRWRYVQDYADAKSDVVAAIVARAMP